VRAYLLKEAFQQLWITTFQRSSGGFEQQSQSHYEKILRLPHFSCLELALYHSLGKLPEPECAHEFF
jgi:hypothetical protein